MIGTCDPFPTTTCEGEIQRELKIERRIPESDARCEVAPVSMYQVESGTGRSEGGVIAALIQVGEADWFGSAGEGKIV